MIRRAFLATTTAASLAGCTATFTGGTDGPLQIEITDGTAGRGETVTLRVTDNGNPVEGATVRLDYQTVGTTDGNGQLTVTLPYEGDDAAIDAEKDDREGELTVEFDGDDQPSVDELTITVVEGSPEPGATITVEVTADGDSVAGAEVQIDGEVSGTTGGNGQLTVTLPETDEDEIEIRADSTDLSGELTISVDG